MSTTAARRVETAFRTASTCAGPIAPRPMTAPSRHGGGRGLVEPGVVVMCVPAPRYPRAESFARQRVGACAPAAGLPSEGVTVNGVPPVYQRYVYLGLCGTGEGLSTQRLRAADRWRSVRPCAAT